MLLRVTVLAVLAIAPCLPASAQSPSGVRQTPSPFPAATSLRLDDAFARVAERHPDLRLFPARRRLLDAEHDEAGLRPASLLGADIEGLAISGSDERLESLETTLTLASVFERGGKLDARRALARSRIDALAMQREATRVDLLAETARRYLAVVSSVHEQAIAGQDIAQRRRVVSAARQRFQAGASPEALVLSAQAALAQAELRAARADQQFDGARRSLAVLWGEADPGFRIAAADPLALPRIDGFAELATLLQRSPELSQFNDAQRVAEARLRLARAQARPDMEWRAGIRHDRDSGDVSLLGGFSIALGQRGRARPGIRAAEAELDLLSLQRESGGQSLLATLADAHGRYEVARNEVIRLREDVLPRIARAEAATERAWRAGAASHLEWAQLQDEHVATLRQQLAAALEAQTALIEIQRLTGQSMLDTAQADTAPDTHSPGDRP